MNTPSIHPSGHYLVFISKKWHLFLLCLHIGFVKSSRIPFVLLTSHNNSGLSVVLVIPVCLIAEDHKIWLINIGFIEELLGMPMCSHK